MTDSFGFFVNEGCPNDGTASATGGYNGTFITNTAVQDGDTVDFFLYQDGDAWSDYYTWIDAPTAVAEGEKVNVTVKGFYAASAYLYKDGAALKAAAKTLEGVQLGWRWAVCSPLNSTLTLESTAILSLGFIMA